MKRINLLTLAILAAVGLTLGASAVSYTVPAVSNDVAIMIVPPVYVAGAGVLQLPQRTTNATVAAGQIYRIGSLPIVAAHAGVITNGTVSTTTYTTNGLVITTNTVVRIQDVTVPLEGLSDYDGTVRWMRTVASRDRIRLKVTVGDETTGTAVQISDGGFNTWRYTTTASDDGFVGYQRALYVDSDDVVGCTNSAVDVWSW